MSNIFTDNSQSIGNTPLIRLNHVTQGARATVLAKTRGATLPDSSVYLQQIR